MINIYIHICIYYIYIYTFKHINNIYVLSYIHIIHHIYQNLIQKEKMNNWGLKFLKKKKKKKKKKILHAVKKWMEGYKTCQLFI